MTKWRFRSTGQYNVSSPDSQSGTQDSSVELDDSDLLPTCTVDEAVEKIGMGFFQIIALSFAGLVWMVEACEILLLTMLSAVLKCEWGLTELEEASLTSVVFVGFFFGCMYWGFFADMYGRKWCIFFVSLWSACFGVMSAFSPNFNTLLLLRSLLGFGAGGAAQGITMCAEFVPAKYRGFAILLTQVFWVVGSVGIVGTGWAVVPTLGWRWLVGFAAVPVILMTFIVPFMPSSPRFLFVKGRKEQAMKVLQIMAKVNCTRRLQVRLVTDQEKEAEKRSSVSSQVSPPPDRAPALSKDAVWNNRNEDDDCVQIADETGTTAPEKTARAEDGETLSIRSDDKGLEVAIRESHRLVPKKQQIRQIPLLDLFKKGMWKTTLLLWMIWFNCVAYYYGIILMTTSLFQYDKHCDSLLSSNCFTDEGPDLCHPLDDDDYRNLLWTSTAEIPGIFLTVLLMAIPCIGRKVVISVEWTLIAVFSAGLMICTSNPRIYLTVMLFMCRGLIAGVFQAVFVYTPEVYSTTVRGLGLGLCSTLGRIGGVLIPYVAQPLLKANEFAAIGVFVALAVVSVVLVAILPIETKGRSLKDTNA